MHELDAAAIARSVEIIRARGEPLPIELLAERLFETERLRAILPYHPDSSYLVGQRVAWQTPSFGRLIGDVTSCEFAAGRWRILVDWDARLSPGLERYLSRREGSRLAYMIDPAAEPPQRDAEGSGGGEADGPTVSQLLEQDLEDALRHSDAFVSWAGLWAPVEVLPDISQADLETACGLAMLDDGIAQTNEILDYLGLPGPSAIGHGFAALAVNHRIQQDHAWVWGGPRDGGQWLPGHRLASAARDLGPIPRLEEDMRLLPIPDLADDELPEGLGELVGDVTIRGLEVNAMERRLDHVLSRWERLRGVFAFDSAEFAFFPAQAIVPLRWGRLTGPALAVPEHRVLIPELDEHRSLIRTSGSAEFERLGSTDELVVTLHPALDQLVPDTVQHDLLLDVVSAFADGQPHDARFVVDHLRSIRPGDLAVVTRAVAAILASYGCFELVDDQSYRYLATEPHSPRTHGRMTTVSAMAVRAARARLRAVADDREMRRFRAAGLRSPHMVRGHLRRIRRRELGNPVQLALARMHGISVPRGFTFVRPHERH